MTLLVLRGEKGAHWSLVPLLLLFHSIIFMVLFRHAPSFWSRPRGRLKYSSMRRRSCAVPVFSSSHLIPLLCYFRRCIAANPAALSHSPSPSSPVSLSVAMVLMQSL